MLFYKEISIIFVAVEIFKLSIMLVDFKVAYWERIFVPDMYQDEVIEKIKRGEIKTVNDLLHQYGDEGAFLDSQFGHEQLTPEEQDGYSTIDILDDDEEEEIFKNGK